jgi:hypothetical protein
MNGHKTYVSWRDCQSVWQPPVRGPIQNSSAELSWEPPWPNPSKKARLGTLCHIVSRCVTLCHVVLHIARALHLHRTPKTTCLWSKQITMCVLPHLDYTTATIARKCSDPFWHETACDNAATAFDWVRTSPGLEMSEETLNYGDKACLKLSRYVMICHD